MYKVFVNEKRLAIGNNITDIQKRMHYEDAATLEIALDLLENTSCPEINVYGENIEAIWADFKNQFKSVGAAGGIVENENGEILFIYRLGKWDLPKGKMEMGETEEQSALREVEEETKLKELEIKKFVGDTFHVYTERNGTKILKTTHWFNMKYTGNSTPIPQVEEGISAVEWKGYDKIEQQILPQTFKNIQLILGEFWHQNS